MDESRSDGKTAYNVNTNPFKFSFFHYSINVQDVGEGAKAVTHGDRICYPIIFWFQSH